MKPASGRQRLVVKPKEEESAPFKAAEELWEKYDANQDGLLAKEEFAGILKFLAESAGVQDVQRRVLGIPIAA